MSEEALDLALAARMWSRSPSSYLPNLDPAVALDLDVALAVRVMGWEADQLARLRRGDRSDVAYERVTIPADPTLTADVEAWHAALLREEGKLH